MRKSRIKWVDNLDCDLIAREEDATAENGPTKSHGGTFPKSPDSIIQEYRFGGFRRACSIRTLRSRLDDVKWLRAESRDDTSDGSIGKVDQRILLDVSSLFI